MTCSGPVDAGGRGVLELLFGAEEGVDPEGGIRGIEGDGHGTSKSVGGGYGRLGEAPNVQVHSKICKIRKKSVTLLQNQGLCHLDYVDFRRKL